jgi:hypothetical protein
MRSPARRRLLYLLFLLLLAALIAAALYLLRPPSPVRIVAPGALIAEMSQADFAAAYYDMLRLEGFKMLGEGGSHYGPAAKPLLLQTERRFALSDQTEVILNITSEPSRHIVFISFRPRQPLSLADAQSLSLRLTETLATYLRQHADSRRFSKLRKLFR